MSLRNSFSFSKSWRVDSSSNSSKAPPPANSNNGSSKPALQSQTSISSVESTSSKSSLRSSFKSGKSTTPKLSFKDPPKNVDRSQWGPILITIGPPCSGKTTIVKALGEHTTDFSLYDRKDMFETIPLSAALEIGSKYDKAAGEAKSAPSDAIFELQSRKSNNISVFDRVQKVSGSEKMFIALCFTNHITIDFFKTRLLILLKGQPNVKILIECVVELMKKRTTMTTETIDIDIEENEDDSKRIILREIEREINVNNGVIVWEHTNLFPHNYMEVLQSCSKYHRCVRFVRWGQEIPVVPLKELIMRNLLRFLKTGRYINLSRLTQTYELAEQYTLEDAEGVKPTHLDFAMRAGFEMDGNGHVVYQPLYVKVNGVAKPMHKAASLNMAVAVAKSVATTSSNDRISVSASDIHALAREHSLKSVDSSAPSVDSLTLSNGGTFKLIETKWSRWTNIGPVFRLDALATMAGMRPDGTPAPLMKNASGRGVSATGKLDVSAFNEPEKVLVTTPSVWKLGVTTVEDERVLQHTEQPTATTRKRPLTPKVEPSTSPFTCIIQCFEG